MWQDEARRKCFMNLLCQIEEIVVEFVNRFPVNFSNQNNDRLEGAREQKNYFFDREIHFASYCFHSVPTVAIECGPTPRRLSSALEPTG